MALAEVKKFLQVTRLVSARDGTQTQSWVLRGPACFTIRL